MDKGVRGKREGQTTGRRNRVYESEEWRRGRMGNQNQQHNKNKMLQHHLAKEEIDTKSDNDESTIGTTTTKGGK